MELGRRVCKTYRFKFVGHVDDLREIRVFNDGLVFNYEESFDEPDYQKRRVYGDEIILADLKQPRWKRVVENGYDGILLFETNNLKNYKYYENKACPNLKETT